MSHLKLVSFYPEVVADRYAVCHEPVERKMLQCCQHQLMCFDMDLDT